MGVGVFIDYTIPEWSKKNQQESIKERYRTDVLVIQRIIRHLPSEKSDLVSEIYYGLKNKMDLPGYTVYVEPTLYEILDLYNGIVNEHNSYDQLEVKSRYNDIDEMAEEYFSILEENKQLREKYKEEESTITERIVAEKRSSGSIIRYSQIWKEAFILCKEKYNPLFLSLHKRMRSYSEEARKFFFKEENLECPRGYDFFRWVELRNNWVNWDHSFYFSNFSPFEKKIKSEPIDMSPNEEDIVMKALRNGEGDSFGF